MTTEELLTPPIVKLIEEFATLNGELNDIETLFELKERLQKMIAVIKALADHADPYRAVFDHRVGLRNAAICGLCDSFSDRVTIYSRVAAGLAATATNGQEN